MTSITNFLLARIAEDEATARDMGAVAMVGAHWKHYPEDAYVEVQSLVLDHSRRMVAECEAKRSIIELHSRIDAEARQHALTAPHLADSARATRIGLDMVLFLLATVHADHPDFDPAWRIADD